MDFFGYQQKARRKSFWLILGVLAAALAVIIAINVIVLIFLGWQQVGMSVAYGTTQGFADLFNPEFLSYHSNTLLMSSAGVAGLMGISSVDLVQSVYQLLIHQ